MVVMAMTNFLSNNNDAIFLDDSFSGRSDFGARLLNIESIYAGFGNDIIDLTSKNWDMPSITIYGGDGNDTIWSSSGDDILSGDAANDVLFGGAGNDLLMGGVGDDTYQFTSNNNQDTISDTSGYDIIEFDSSNISKSTIALFMDASNNLIVDYGSIPGNNTITIQNQSTNSIEKIQLNYGTFITNTDINSLIQSMTAYATNHNMQLTNIDQVKNNADLMNLVSNSWH
jgi:Ca2+-binding RTX toxin-like protein